MGPALDTSFEQHSVPPRAPPLIQVEHVTRMYSSGTVALSDVSFEVEEGQFVCLVGPSGCGKSTLLRAIAGLGTISCGRLLVRGMPAVEARTRLAETAFVFQDATLMPWRTVLGNVELPLELRGVPRAERRHLASQALGLVGLGGTEKAYPRQLSGGMRMRVSLARALAASPRLLVMDEPFGALDEITRQHLNGELLRIRDIAGWTVVFVTHNVFEAVYLSSRIIVMSRQPGRVVGDLAVNLPYPRLPDVRTSSAYSELVGQVIRLLNE
jgi:NitT/TauT family transport system ATP-binding protein